MFDSLARAYLANESLSSRLDHHLSINRLDNLTRRTLRRHHLFRPDPAIRQHRRLVSLGTKVLRNWEGPTWDAERTSVVRLLTEQAIVQELAYVVQT